MKFIKVKSYDPKAEMYQIGLEVYSNVAVLLINGKGFITIHDDGECTVYKDGTHTHGRAGGEKIQIDWDFFK